MIEHRSLLNSELRHALRCPVTGRPLTLSEDGMSMSADGSPTYPVVNGIPVLIDERSGVFRHDEILKGQFRYSAPKHTWREKVADTLPSLSRNLAAEKNYKNLRARLLAETPRPKLLVLGGGGLGVGLSELVLDPAFDVVESDVYFGERTNLICDAHQIPFADGTFDGIVLQGVIQALLDPRTAVDEIHRVLKPRGLFYIEAAFMQAICDGRYDFNRFTHSGLRRLCRRFEEIDSGIQCGPGMAFGWTYMYWIASFTSNKATRLGLRTFARLSAFWLKWLDPYLAKQRAAYDVAAGFYLLGRRSDVTRSDREIIESYRGDFA